MMVKEAPGGADVALVEAVAASEYPAMRPEARPGTVMVKPGGVVSPALAAISRNRARWRLPGQGRWCESARSGAAVDGGSVGMSAGSAVVAGGSEGTSAESAVDGGSEDAAA